MIKLSKLLVVACVIFTVKSMVDDAFSLNSERIYSYFISVLSAVVILVFVRFLSGRE